MEDRRLTNWTDERVDQLKALWSKGATASEIAAELGGVTRNAVCGKIDRLGLSGKSRAEKIRAARNFRAPRPQAPEVKSKSLLKVGVGAQVQAINRIKKAASPELIKEDFTPRVVDVPSHRVTILEVRAMECRWPDEDRNEDGVHTFCGNPTEDASSYCPAHAALAIGQGTASERAALSVLKREAA